MQMVFPCHKPFKLWVVRCEAVRQRNCTSLLRSVHICHSALSDWGGMLRGPTPRHRTATRVMRLADSWACFQIAGSLTVTGIDSTHRQTFRQFDQTLWWFLSLSLHQISADSQITAWVTAAHYKNPFRFFKLSAIPSTPVPSSSSSYPNWWGPSILTSKDTSIFFVCRTWCKHDLLRKTVYRNDLYRVKRHRFRAVSHQLGNIVFY